MSRPPGVHPRDLRASDTDRERVVAVLGEAYAEGRLTADEHGQRVGHAYAARTLGTLAVLLRDLPGGPEAAGLPAFEDGPVTAAFGRRDRSGRWVLPAQLTVGAVGGAVTLDLTEAVFAADHAVVTALCAGGALTLLAPPWVQVDVEGNRLVAVRRVGDRWASAQPSARVTVRAFGLGQVVVRRQRPPRPRRR